MKTDENWFDCWFRRTILDCEWLLLFRCISQAFTLRHQCFEVQVNFLGSKNIDHRSNVGSLYWRFWAKTLGHFDHQHTLFLNISFEHQHCKDVTKIEIFLPTWCWQHWQIVTKFKSQNQLCNQHHFRQSICISSKRLEREKSSSFVQLKFFWRKSRSFEYVFRSKIINPSENSA